MRALLGRLQADKQYNDNYGSVKITNAATAYELVMNQGCCGINLAGRNVCFTDSPLENVTVPESERVELLQKQRQSYALKDLVGDQIVDPVFCRSCWRLHHTIAGYGMRQMVGLGTWTALNRFLYNQESGHYLECTCEVSLIETQRSGSMKKTKTELKSPGHMNPVIRSLVILAPHGKCDHVNTDQTYAKVLIFVKNDYSRVRIPPQPTAPPSRQSFNIPILVPGFVARLSGQCEVNQMASFTITVS